MLKLKSAGSGMLLLVGVFISCLSTTCLAGQTKADEDILVTLNTRYQNAVSDCDGNTAFYCSGVLLSEDRSWENGDTADEAASFSFLRTDINIQHLFPVGSGYIFKDQATATTDGDALALYCAYAFNASTDDRPDSTLGPACGTELPGNIFYNSCKEAGIVTLEDYAAYFNSDVVSGNQALYQCAFDANDPNDVNLFILGHNYVGSGAGVWNEVVLQGWFYSNGQIPPIEAFFYEVQSGSDSNKTSAESQRSDFEAKTGIHVPVVGIDLTHSDAPFVESE